MANVNISNYTTIGSLYEYNSQLNISHDRLFLKSLVQSNDNTLITDYTSLINKYFDIVLKHCYTVTLSDMDYMKYRYQPKLYCYERFGTTELWSLLLKVNHWTSFVQFNKKTFKTFNSSIFNVINDIFILSADYINDNEESIGR